MALPPDFQFSQSSLQDYVDCRQRFFLRHLRRLNWPAVEAEPALENELAMQRGSFFHNLVRQHLLGIPEEKLGRLASEEDLDGWWQAYLESISGKLEGARYAEIALSMPLQGHRLLAKYDLLLVRPGGKAIIYDWKTSAHKMKRQTLLGRLQTRIYPYLLVQAGAFLNQGSPFAPTQVEMIYWFTGAPAQPELIGYGLDQCRQDEQYLQGLICEIGSLSEGDFFRTERQERCSYCTYRSLCDRGCQAGLLDPAVELDFDQVEAIEF